MPTANDMQTILNQIRGQFPNWQVVFNQFKSVGPLGFWLQPVTLAAGLAEAQFSVVWENANLTQTNSSNPGPNQVSITLVQPPGIVLQDAPTLSGGGYCVFNKPTPSVVGQTPWYVQVIYPGTVNPLPVTIGVFPSETSPSPRLQLSAAAPPKAGAPVQVDVTLEGATEPIEITAATAEIVAPRMALDRTLRIYADALKEVACEQDGPLPRLLALRQLLLPKGDILGHERRMIPLAMTGKGSIPSPPHPQRSGQSELRDPHPGSNWPRQHGLRTNRATFAPCSRYRQDKKTAIGTSRLRRTLPNRFLLRYVGGPDLKRSFVAGELGFEPRQTESESVVLPLHHSPKLPSSLKSLRRMPAIAGEGILLNPVG